MDTVLSIPLKLVSRDQPRFCRCYVPFQRKRLLCHRRKLSTKKKNYTEPPSDVSSLAVLDTRQLCRSTRGYGTGANESVSVRRWVDYDATDASKGGEKVFRFSDGLVYLYTGKTGNIWDCLIFTVKSIFFTLLLIWLIFGPNSQLPDFDCHRTFYVVAYFLMFVWLVYRIGTSTYGHLAVHSAVIIGLFFYCSDGLCNRLRFVCTHQLSIFRLLLLTGIC